MAAVPTLTAATAPLLSCQRCGKAVDAALWLTCVECRCTMCAACTKQQIPNRLHAGVCVRCPVVKTALPCGRCSCSVPCDAMEFFCDMCANPICSNCLWTSFEDGQLKCAWCCDYPVVRRLAAAAIPYLLTEAVLQAAPAVLQDVALPATKPLPEPPAASSKYEKLLERKELGKGAQGVVYKCRTADGEVVVSKEMIFGDCDRPVFESQLRQALRMKELQHHHLIRYLDVYARYDPLRLLVVMPYYSEGDLSSFINRQRRPVGEWRLCSIVLQINIALEYLHTQTPPLVHRDIKPENVLLLNNEEQVLLMDLDLCRSVDITASVVKIKNASPTYEYKAPELAYSAGSIKADVFSLGVVMFVLATLPEFPMIAGPGGEKMVLCAKDWKPESLEAALRREIHRIGVQSRSYTYSQGFTQLLIDMLRHDPIRRPTATEVKKRMQEIMEVKLFTGTE